MKKVKLSLLLVAMGMLALVACKDKDKVVKENSTIPATKQLGTGNTEMWRIPTAEEVIGRWETKSRDKVGSGTGWFGFGITGTRIYSAYVDPTTGEWSKDTLDIVWDAVYSLKDGVLSFMIKDEYGIERELKYIVRVHEGKLKMKHSEEDFRAARVKLLERLKEEVEKREGKEKEAIEKAIQEWSDEEEFEKRMKIATAERVFSRFKGM